MSEQDGSVKFAIVQVERSYAMREHGILRFNIARSNGKDLDDSLDAAWRAMLSKSESPKQNDYDALRAENERLERKAHDDGLLRARYDQELDQLRAKIAALKDRLVLVRQQHDELVRNNGLEEQLAALSSPAAGQTEQQPAFLLEIGADGKYAVLVRDKEWLRAMRGKRAHQTHNLYATPIAQTPAGQDVSALVEAIEELFAAREALTDFERENPGNSTKRWEACLYRIEAAEDALHAALAAHKAGGGK